MDRAVATKSEGDGKRDGRADAAAAGGLNDNGTGGGGVGSGMADRALRQMMGGSLADKKVWGERGGGRAAGGGGGEGEDRGGRQLVHVGADKGRRQLVYEGGRGGGRTGGAGSWCMSGKGTRLTLEQVHSSRLKPLNL